MEVWGSTFFWAFIVFLLWCSIAAASKVSKEEKQKGQLNKNKFVYHTPLHVLTREVSPKDNGKKFKFKCKDVEPNSFVEFKVESENSNEFLIKVGIGGEKQDIPVICHPTCKLGVRIGEDKSLCLVTELFPETESSIIRVTVLSWKI